MHKICRMAVSTQASRVIDRFHLRGTCLGCGAGNTHRPPLGRQHQCRNGCKAENAASLAGRRHINARHPAAGDTLKELLARGRYALFKSPEKWTDLGCNETQGRHAVQALPDLKGSILPVKQKPQSHIQQALDQGQRTPPDLARWVQPRRRSRIQVMPITIAATFL